MVQNKLFPMIAVALAFCFLAASVGGGSVALAAPHCPHGEGDVECEAHGVHVWVDDDGEQHVWRWSNGPRGFLGVHLTAMTPELREHLGAPADAGVLISKIEPASPAEEADLRVGDILTAVDGEEIDSARQLRHHIVAKEEGDVVTLDFYRDGKLHQVSATLVERQGHGHRFHFEDMGEHFRDALHGVEWHEIGERIHEAIRKALESVEDLDLSDETEDVEEEDLSEGTS